MSYEGSLQLVARQVADIIADLDLHTYYQLLEVEADAATGVVEYNYDLMIQAYRRLLRHPRCSGTLQSNLTRLCERLDEAHRVLSDRELRRAYDGGVELGETRLGGETLHPITCRTTSGQLTLADFDLEISPNTEPLLDEVLSSPFEPEPALETAPGRRPGDRLKTDPDHHPTIGADDSFDPDGATLEEAMRRSTVLRALEESDLDKKPVTEDTERIEIPPRR